MNTARWHLIEYDIANPKRLAKVYRLLKGCAYALQESVFVWYGTNQELVELQQQLYARIKKTEDDIRGYYLTRPVAIFGNTPFVKDAYFSGLPPHQHYDLDFLSLGGEHAVAYLL